MELDRIEALLKLMQEYGVAELGIEEEGAGVHLRLMGEAAAAPVAVAPVPVAVAPTPQGGVAAATEVAENITVVKSPMVGTFYRSPKPESPAFVKVGDRVDAGEVLCIVEAMKLMNEIEAETSGVIREVLIENAQPVQFGQALFHIEAE